MKKQKLKLGLNKINVSNLSTINGGFGNPFEVATFTRVDMLCCPVLGTEECPNTQVTTCHGDTSRNCTEQTHCLC